MTLRFREERYSLGQVHSAPSPDKIGNVAETDFRIWISIIVIASGKSGVTAASVIQRCIEPKCGASYGINERLYVCSRCGGLLDGDQRPESIGDANVLPGAEVIRLRSLPPKDLNRVWRYREAVPLS